ncbi:unnamed protein product [Leptidea sinapis]|uniref:Uncharacterized protein n=1 Tax=Leptidea sinapis TaxID=189913 RepID=A0A5E4Q2X8_9NEOP|nr:unnamed protein product [Leptidea sinapis]
MLSAIKNAKKNKERKESDEHTEEEQLNSNNGSVFRNPSILSKTINSTQPLKIDERQSNTKEFTEAETSKK